MEKNKIYIVIFVLLVVLITLLGMFNLLGSRLGGGTNEQNGTNPTITGIVNFPTSLPFVTKPPTPTIAPIPEDANRVFSLPYPVKYENLILDYIPKKRVMIIYYPGERQTAEELFNRFLQQYEASSSAALKLNVEFIGLQRLPGEPIPGQGQQ